MLRQQPFVCVWVLWGGRRDEGAKTAAATASAHLTATISTMAAGTASCVVAALGAGLPCYVSSCLYLPNSRAVTQGV